MLARAKDSCSDLKPGESKDYAPFRKNSSVMTAPMRIRNVSRPGLPARYEWASTSISASLAELMRAPSKRVRECFNEVNSKNYLKGPGGESYRSMSSMRTYPHNPSKCARWLATRLILGSRL